MIRWGGNFRMRDSLIEKGSDMSGNIFVYADWMGLSGPRLVGTLQVTHAHGKEVFSFSYDKDWLQGGVPFELDPDLRLYTGSQFVRGEKPNFGLFTDSAPDSWGRVLMGRRERFLAVREGRNPRKLSESDFLLGVYDGYRMGALRFKLQTSGPFLDNQESIPSPPLTSLRTLEQASLHLEEEGAEDDPAFGTWIKELLSPGASLGGARPKVSVVDPKGRLWIAKFPSRGDNRDVGGWEAVAQVLAGTAGLEVAVGQARKLTKARHTFLTRRFDRVGNGRIHFVSAMTLLGRTDGAGAAEGTSYLDLAELIMRVGAQPEKDMEELWRRIVFNIAITNSDDHLRNHGFLLTPNGWVLSPAYDLNPIPDAHGLTLNIDEQNNALDMDLAREVAGQFRVGSLQAGKIIDQVMGAVRPWREVASNLGIARSEIALMENAFLHSP